MKKLSLSLLTAGIIIASQQAAALQINIQEDVMTSSFYSGDNRVRGYATDDRNVHRVSKYGSYIETMYITFNANDFASLKKVNNATLTITSADGGFGANASKEKPFIVSAHAVDSNPLTSIKDDTNPTGNINWKDFYNNNILQANNESLVTVDSFGKININVSSIVNSWIDGSNNVFALAITGKNHNLGTSILHGFLNNSENPGATYLTVQEVPVPAAAWLFASALVGIAGIKKSK